MRDRVVVVSGPGRVELVEQDAGELRDGTFRVETLYSGVSTGTELSFVKGTNPYLNVAWNAGLGLFQPGRPAPHTRSTGWATCRWGGWWRAAPRRSPWAPSLR